MSADALLSNLQKVRKTGSGRWLACCPAHDDKRPSMTIRELDDGRVLLHCFGGCSAESILGAVGLEFDALFPEKLADRLPAQRKPFNAHDVLKAVVFEASIVAIIGGDMLNRQAISEEDFARLQVAIRRLQDAEDMVNGER